MFKNVYPILIILLIISSIVGLVWFVSRDNADNLSSNIYRAIDQQERSQETQSNVNNSTAKIINLHSHPQQGENWIISFQTQGTADLRIIPQDQATIEDDEFVALYCGNKQVTPQILENDVIYYKNWSCSEKAQVIHYTKKAGRHTLKFQFGQTVMYAYNSAAWYNPAWTKRKKITIDNTYVDSNLTDFPLMLEVATGSGAGTSMGTYAQADGDDVIFTTDDGITQIPHATTSFSITNNLASGIFYAKVPAISSGTTTDIYVYYGNPNAANSEQRSEVWEGGVGVWLMNEGTGDTVADLSGNGNNGTLKGNTYFAVGSRGTNLVFDGAEDYVDLGSGQQLSAFTIVVWVKNVPYDNNTKIIIERQDYDSPWAMNYRFAIDPYNELELKSYVPTTSHTVSCQASGIYGNSAAFDDWVQIGVAWAGGNEQFYINGSPVATTSGDISALGVPVSVTTLLLGIHNSYTTSEFSGDMGSTYLYNQALTASEVKFGYYNQNEADNELTWDSEESFSVPAYMRIK